MEQRIPEGRFTARPYVVASFGTVAASGDWRWDRVLTGEAFAMPESWAFNPTPAPYLRYLDAGYCSAHYNADILEAQGDYFRCNDEGVECAVLSAEGLATWCVRRVLTYPASNGVGTLVSGLDYIFEIWAIQIGDVRGVVGFAVPQFAHPAASLAEMRQYVGMWARATFGPAFLPNDLSGWRKVAAGGADRYGFGVRGEYWAHAWKVGPIKAWNAGPRTWNAWA